jgi:acyl transferase domain-containing protein/NAD(P)-dependent dehydrogenase (short-subunit alcohol dehydrogenase family)
METKMTKNTASNTPVAVIGLSCFFPRATGIRAYWHLLYHGKDAITDVPPSHWSPGDYFDEDPSRKDHVYCRRGGFLSPIQFDPTEFGIPPSNLESTDSSQLLGLMAAQTALETAGYGKNKDFDRERTSVILGVTGTQELVIPLSSRLSWPKWKNALEKAQVDPVKTRQVMDDLADEYVEWQENSFPGLLGNVVAGRICNRLDLNGTNCVVDAACASSLSAVNLSLLELYTGRANMVVTGGVDTLNDIFMHMCFARTQILSPTGDARPFSCDADGTVLGEGVGILILKRLEDAEKDGDRVLAVIKGIGSSSDGKSQSIYAPRAEGQLKALQKAYGAAGVDPQSIDLIEAHGTGTRVGDKIEVQALKQLFDGDGNHRHCALGSVKSMIGHTKAAAGAAGLIKAVLALHHKILPPTLKAIPDDPDLGLKESPFYLNTAAQPWFRRRDQPRRAGVSAFGFGGSNFHVVLEEYRADRSAVSWDGSIEIIALSADSHLDLQRALQKARQSLQDAETTAALPPLANRLRRDFKHEAPYRLVMVLQREEDGSGPVWNWNAVLEEAAQGLEKDPDQPFWFGRHCFLGQGATPGEVAFIFPGQGSQYPQMGRDWVAWFPEALASIEAAAGHFNDPMPLTDYIYPRPDDSLKTPREEALRQTNVAQPAIGAVSIAMEKVLRRFGVTPAFTCGHSYGELTALFSAGWIDEATLHTLSVLRGQLMAAAGGPDGASSGTMMAVKAPLDKLDQLIKTENLGVVLANRNSPNQGVLSGSIAAIDEAEAACKAKNFRTIKLPVAAAFHSALMQKAQAPFAAALEKITLTPSDIHVYANTNGRPYPDEPAQVKSILGDHLLNAVNFVDEIKNLHQAGARIFVEVGPKTVLTGLVRQILKGEAIHAMATDAGSGRNFGILDLATTLGKLTALGCPVDLPEWESPDGDPRQPRMQIPISGANFQKKKTRKAAPSAPPKSAETNFGTGPKMQASSGHHAAQLATSPNKQSIPQAMNLKHNDHDPRLRDAFNLVQQGLQSLQSLQQQTTAAHQKFLETQQQASLTLQEMIASTRRFAEAALGNPTIPPDMGRTFSRDASASSTPLHPPVSALPQREALDPPVASPMAADAPAGGPSLKMAPAPDVPASAARASEVQQVLRQVVGELTGYPENMLGMELDLESDLGIDSIKRVEILSTLEERLPSPPETTPETMAGLKTLGQVAAFIAGTPGALPSAALPPQVAAPAAPPFDKPGADVKNTLLAVVSDLTGYPTDMLTLDMNVESDLGIDSIKRVEILSALEERLPNVPTVAPDEMAELKTLGEIVNRLATATHTIDADIDTPPAARPSPSSTGVSHTVMAVVSDLTGYPVDMLAPEMDIESDLGIDSIKRVEILSVLEERVPNLQSTSPEEMTRLKTLGQIIEHLDQGGEKSPQDRPAKISRETTTPTDAIPLRRLVRTVPADIEKGPRLELNGERRVYLTTDRAGLSHALADALSQVGLHTVQISADILAHRDALPEAAGLIIIGDAEAPPLREDEDDHDLVENTFRLMKHLGPSLQRATGEGGAFLATIARLDGQHGFGTEPLSHPLQGALAGLCKTAALEWKGVTCRAFDAAADWKDNPRIAKIVVDALLHPSTSTPVEIGLQPSQAYQLKLESTEESAKEIRRLDLEDNDVVVVSGGARGVTAAAVIELARTRPLTFILLGRSPQPLDEPPWLHDLNDAAAIKQAIITNEFRHETPTPQAVEALYKRLMHNREINATLAAVTAAGATARYYAVDICDAPKLEAVIKDVRLVHGPVKALIHGAGVLQDRLIVDKTPEQFRLVFNTKVKGLQNLLQSTVDAPLRWIVLFSSVAARFGNIGQADYAAANEALNKLAQSEAIKRNGCRIKSINWGPWDGGMVSPALKKAFEHRGIPLISVKSGTRALIAEMDAASDDAIEIVIGSELPPSATSDRLESLPPPAVTLPTNPTASTAFQSEISLEQYPILDDHRLDGKPVVPMALIAEWMGHGALHNYPGMLLTGIDDMRLLKGIVLESDRPRPIRVLAADGRARKDGFQIPMELHNGQAPNQSVIHCRALALVSDRIAEPPACTIPPSLVEDSYQRRPADIYADILFHGRRLQGLRRVIASSSDGMRAEIASAPAPSQWIKNPARNHWIADPLIMDGAFQMASLWCYEQCGKVSLPSYFEAYRQYCRRFPEGALQTILTIRRLARHKITGDFFFLDRDQQVLATIRGFEGVMDDQLMQAFKPGRSFAA